MLLDAGYSWRTCRGESLNRGKKHVSFCLEFCLQADLAFLLVVAQAPIGNATRTDWGQSESVLRNVG